MVVTLKRLPDISFSQNQESMVKIMVQAKKERLEASCWKIGTAYLPSLVQKKEAIEIAKILNTRLRMNCLL